MQETEKFDSHKFSRDFEKLSLEIVEIRYFNGISKVNIIEKDVTKETRDKGVDGYIKFNVNDSVQQYTIEAKLRTSNSLGLTDFASSILYSLLNLSNRHFVVTNILYSSEAIEVIHKLDAQGKGNISLIDGRQLQTIINKQLSLFEKYPIELIEFIQTRQFPAVTKTANPFVAKTIKSDFTSTAFLNKQVEDILKQYRTGTYIFFIEGEAGTGKTCFIEHLLLEFSEHWSVNIRRLDMQVVSTPLAFCLELIQAVTGIDLLYLLNLLSVDDKKYIVEEQKDLIENADEIGIALKILFGEKEYEKSSYHYYMQKFIEKILNNRTTDDILILYFYNLEKTLQTQMDLLLESLNIFTKYNVVVFIEFLLPQTQTQIKQISQENWYNFRNMFIKNKYLICSTYPMTLENYTHSEQVEILKKEIKVPLSNQYYNTVSQFLGNNPETFYLGIRRINQDKLYTTSMIGSNIGQFQNKKVLWEDALKEYYSSDKKHILQDAIAIAYLLEDTIPDLIIADYSKKYNCPVKDILLASPFFIHQIGGIQISSELIFSIKNVISETVISKSGNYILDNINKIFYNQQERIYFTCILHILIENELNISEIKNCLKNLKENSKFIRYEKLLYLIYKKIKTMNYSKRELFQIIIFYLNFVNDQYTYYSEKSKELFCEAEYLYEELELFGLCSEIDVELLLKYNELMYKKNKASYNYEVCKIHVDRILQYEEKFPQYEQLYISAHIWQALNYKEYGYYHICFKEYINAMRKYPSSRELVISFGMNASAYYYFKCTTKAVHIMKKLIKYVEKDGVDYKNHLWLYHDYVMLNMLNHEYNLPLFYQLRKIAEIRNASNVLARSFNMEGFYYFAQKEFFKAKECLEVAVKIGIMAGKNKPFFLFLTNLITIKTYLNEDVQDEFQDALCWINTHCNIIHQRLSRSSKLETEHIFAALISCLISSERAKTDDLSIRQQIVEKCYDVDYQTVDELYKLVHPLYRYNNEIFILF